MHIVMQTVDTMKRNISAIHENFNQLLKKPDGSSKKTLNATMWRPRAVTFESAVENEETTL